MFDPLNYPLFITKNPLTIMNSPLNITFHPLSSYAIKGEFAAKLKDDSLLLKERLLSHNGEFVSIKGLKK